MPKIDLTAVPARKGSGYPPPLDAPCAARTRRRLGEAGGLRDFGVNLMTLPPGGWSSQRHWHSHEDEFVYVLEGTVTLIEDGGDVDLGHVLLPPAIAILFLSGASCRQGAACNPSPVTTNTLPLG